MILESEDVLDSVGYYRGYAVLQRMESKAALRNRMQAAGDPRVRYLIQQLDKHPIKSPPMQRTFLAGEGKVRSIIDSEGEVCFETGVV